MNNQQKKYEFSQDVFQSFKIDCHKHPKNPIIQGCSEIGCQDNIQCEQCIKESQEHARSHRGSIMTFQDYLYTLIEQLKNTQANKHSENNKKLKTLMNSEQSLIRYFDSKMKQEKENFAKHADLLGTILMHKIIKLKKDVEDFFDKQIYTFKNNVLYFKQQYNSLNPEDTFLKYTDILDIKQTLLTKTPYQAYHFLTNLRKSAGMEGKIMSHLIYVHDKIIKHNNEPPHFGKNIYQTNMDELKDVVNQIDSKCRQSLIDLPELHTDYVAEQSQNLINFNRKGIQINSLHLLDKLKYDFSVTGLMQTYHLNSVTAMVCLSDDICATASYDRTIKIWRLSDGFLLKTLQDKNSITSLCVIKMSNQKQNLHSHTESDQQLIASKIRDNPDISLSALGYLLVSGGFDRVIKIWDFNFVEQYQRSKTNVEEYEGDNIFQEQFKNVNKEYFDKHSTSYNQYRSMKQEVDIENKKRENLSKSQAHLHSQKLMIPNILTESLLPTNEQLYNTILPVKELRGHTRWVTSLCSLEDEHNIASGDEGGEIIIWNVMPYTKQLFRLQFGQETYISQIVLQNPYRNLAVASQEKIQTWKLQYVEDDQLFVPRLQSATLDKHFHVKDFIYCINVPYNFKNILVVGCKSGVIKYIDTAKNKMVSINTEHDEFVGDIILLEKIRVLESEEDYFHKNMNFIIVGSRKLGLYNGYGQLLSSVQPVNNEDFAASTILPGRNLSLLKVGRKQELNEIKILAVSQFSSDYYNYKSSRISVISLISQFIDFH